MLIDDSRMDEQTVTNFVNETVIFRYLYAIEY